MNALQRAKRDREWEKIRGRLGPFGACTQDMCGLIDECGGWPDVDAWCGSTIREWWNEETDGEAMIEVIHRVGLAAPVYRLDSTDEIRRLVRYEDFIRAAEAHVRENADY